MDTSTKILRDALLHADAITSSDGPDIAPRTLNSYVNGMLVGMLSTGMTCEAAVAAIRAAIPDINNDIANPNALPGFVLEDQNAVQIAARVGVLPSDIFRMQSGMFDNNYQQLCRRFTPMYLIKSGDYERAKAALAVAESLGRRGERSYGTEVYIEVVKILLGQYREDIVKNLTGQSSSSICSLEQGRPDKEVLSALFMVSDFTSWEVVIQATGHSMKYIERLLNGTLTCNRHDINAFCKVFNMGEYVFDRSENAGRSKRKYVVHEHFNGFEIEDTTTGNRHWLGDGVDVMTDAFDETISPGTWGFARLWEDDFNAAPGETHAAYFWNASEEDTEETQESDDTQPAPDQEDDVIVLSDPEHGNDVADEPTL